MRTHTVHRHGRAQSLVEFSLIAPIFFTMLFGMIGVGWLFFQDAAIQNAARAAVREASIETSYENSSNCESGDPSPIQTTAQSAANIVTVNPNTLCLATSGTDTGDLVQASTANNTASIVLSAQGGWSSPTEVTATITYYPLPFLFGTNLVFVGSSSLPPEPAR